MKKTNQKEALVYVEKPTVLKREWELVKQIDTQQKVPTMSQTKNNRISRLLYKVFSWVRRLCAVFVPSEVHLFGVPCTIDGEIPDQLENEIEQMLLKGYQPIMLKVLTRKKYEEMQAEYRASRREQVMHQALRTLSKEDALYIQSGLCLPCRSIRSFSEQFLQSSLLSLFGDTVKIADRVENN